MKLISKTKKRRLNGQQTKRESGQTLHEVLIASSILGIAISGLASGIIRSNQITHQASLLKTAESAMTKDLESTVKRRFYTFRCRQGPCQSSPEENDKSLMYYDQKDHEDKQDFISSCNNRDLAKELLSEDENQVTTGKKIIYNSSLDEQDILITRTIALDDSNNNQAIINYDAEKNNEVIATIRTTLVPNAVNWCG